MENMGKEECKGLVKWEIDMGLGYGELSKRIWPPFIAKSSFLGGK